MSDDARALANRTRQCLATADQIAELCPTVTPEERSQLADAMHTVEHEFAAVLDAQRDEFRVYLPSWCETTSYGNHLYRRLGLFLQAGFDKFDAADDRAEQLAYLEARLRLREATPADPRDDSQVSPPADLTLMRPMIGHWAAPRLLAEYVDAPVKDVDTFLRRYATKHPDCRRDNRELDPDGRIMNDPGIEYRTADVLSELQKRAEKWRAKLTTK